MLHQFTGTWSAFWRRRTKIGIRWGFCTDLPLFCGAGRAVVYITFRIGCIRKKRTYTTFRSGIWDRLLHDGPCSAAKISQTRFFPILGRKCLSQALLMFPIVISSLSSKGTNSLGPILVYFCAFPATSADKRWTVNSSPRRWFLGGSFFVLFVRFAFIFSLSFFHAASAMIYVRACDSNLRNACW